MLSVDHLRRSNGRRGYQVFFSSRCPSDCSWKSCDASTYRSPIPDLLIGLAIVVVVFKGGLEILRKAKGD